MLVSLGRSYSGWVEANHFFRYQSDYLLTIFFVGRVSKIGHNNVGRRIILVRIYLDGQGTYHYKSSIPFFQHKTIDF